MDCDHRRSNPFSSMIGVNSLSYLFSKDVGGILDNLTSTTGYSEKVIEQGTGKDKIAVLTLDGVIQDTGEVSSLFASGYNHQFFMSQLNEIYEDSSVKGVILK